MEIKEPIDQNKKLNIIVIADHSEYGLNAIRHGNILAMVFKASLSVITRFGFSFEEKKKGNAFSEQDIVPFIDGSLEYSVSDRYFFPESLYHYAESTNTIMYVIGVDRKEKNGFFNINKAIRFIKPSRLPVMTVGKKTPSEKAYQQVLLPVDIERQAKEKALWAGYFSRFYQSTIHILHAEYKDEGLKKLVNDNIEFVEKLYHNLEIKYVLDHTTPQKNLDVYSIDFTSTVQASLTVIMMTRYFTPADIFLGPQEKKIIGNEQGLPVLCINQRDDLYVLCT